MEIARGMFSAALLLALLPPSSSVNIHWEETLVETQTTPTCQVVVEPPMWPTSDVRETQLHWLAELGSEASPVFWQSWYLYPRAGVAELSPGSWDFSEITPLIQDMLNATKGRQLVFQFGTVPTWLQNGPTGDRRWDYGTQAWNATQTWKYNAPDNFSSPVFRNLSQVGEYYANFISYYTAGGFTDARTGNRYDGFHYNIPWFEFGNEMEYKQTPAVFSHQHDVVTAAVAKVAPAMKFLGLGLGQDHYSASNLSYFEYFLNASNHAPGAPRAEAIDYHYYATPSSRTNVSTYHELFAQGDAFIQTVEAAEQVRLTLSPRTKTYLKELGVILHGDPTGAVPIPDLFWSASAAYWAYLYSRLAKLKIDVVGMSQLVGGPNSPTADHGPNFPSVTMLDWRTGRPTARWYALKMLVRAFGNRTKRMVPTELAGQPQVHARAFEVSERDGTKARKLLLVNKRIESSGPIVVGKDWSCVESIGGNSPWAAPNITAPSPAGVVTLASFGVAILSEAPCPK